MTVGLNFCRIWVCLYYFKLQQYETDLPKHFLFYFQKIKPQSKNICAEKEVSQMNSFVHTRTDLPEIALFWNNALSRRNFRHSLGRQHLALYFKVSVFLRNEGRDWERDVFNQTDFAVVRISSRKMYKKGQNRKYYILFISTGNRRNKGILSPDHVHKERLSLKTVSLLLKTCFSLTDECCRIA